MPVGALCLGERTNFTPSQLKLLSRMMTTYTAGRGMAAGMMLLLCTTSFTASAQHVRALGTPQGAAAAAKQAGQTIRPIHTSPLFSAPNQNLMRGGGGAPLNDDCAGATVITPSVTCVPTTGDVAGATQSIPGISCAGFTGTADDDVWFAFVATATEHTVIVQPSAEFDAVLDLRSGACPGVNIDCSDVGFDGGAETINATGLTIGETYYARVYDWFNGAPSTTTFTICVLVGAPPAPDNDDCADAEVLTINPAGGCPGNATDGDNGNATFTGADPACDAGAGGYQDVWYTFNSGGNSTVQVDLGIGSIGDIGIELFDACGGTSLFCDFSLLTYVLTVDPATDYLIRVYTNTDFGTGGTFTICLSEAAVAPANDNCADVVADPLEVGSPLTYSGTTVGATNTNDAVPGTILDFQADSAVVWHAFTLNDCANVTVEYCGSDPVRPIVLIVLTTSCPADDNVIIADAFSDDCVDGNYVITYLGVQPGTYYIPVFSDGQLVGDYELLVTAESCAVPPVNDECVDAIALDVNLLVDCPGNAVAGDNSESTITFDEPDCDSSVDGFQDVWYTFNSDANTVVTIDLEAITATDLYLEVLDACGGNSIFCDIDDSPYVVSVDPFTDYVVRVFSNLDFGTGGEFTICISGDFGIGMTEPGATGVFTVFPNPAREVLNVVPLMDASDAVIDLFDISGRVVLSANMPLVAAQPQVIALPGHLARGTYVLRVASGAWTHEQRVTID